MTTLMRCLLVFLLLSFAQLAKTQDAGSVQVVEDARRQIADIRNQLQQDDLPTTTLAGFRDAAAALANQADGLIAERTPSLQDVDARLAELGAAPDKTGPVEAPDVSAQRNALNARRSALDSELKRAKLLSADAQQLAGEIANARRARFQAALSQRVSTPLLPPFWRDTANLSRESGRFRSARDQLQADIGNAIAATHRLAALLALGIGLALLLFGRRSAEALLLRRLGQGPSRRSWAPAALAIAVTLLCMILPGLGAQAMRAGLGGSGIVSESFVALSGGLVAAVLFGGLVHGLGHALLMPGLPAWRLAPINDALAARLRLFPPAFGLATALAVMLDRINSVLGTGLAATILTSLLIAVLYNGLIGWLLLHIRRANRQADATIGAPAPRPAWAKFAFLLAGFGVVIGFACTVTGYLALAAFIGRQMVWIGMVGIAFHLLARLIDELSASVLSTQAGWARNASGLGPRTLDQLAILVSGVLRVALFLFALVLVLVPFDTSPAHLLQRGVDIGAGLKIGALTIAPGSLFPALAALVLGFLALRVLQRWLAQRYLPTTTLEPGIQNSISTLLGYVGSVIVLAFGLSSLGISVERIAWIASALSVGIGFGLQAIVQNFISGVILLVERPVKVGDLVAIGDVEGDIRRINVRATEIQLSDRSTLIVPNSEFITKTVRNISLANAEGRIRVRLPLPMDTDARRAREIMLQAIAAQPDILSTPAPSVLLDGIEANMLMFTVNAFVASPRVAGGVRSELLFDILARLRSEDIALSTAQDLRLQVQRGEHFAASADDAAEHA